MSLNLVFKKGNKYIDFPFQTTTILTNHVLACSTNWERLILLAYQLNIDGWEMKEAKKILAEISEKLNDEKVVLTSI